MASKCFARGCDKPCAAKHLMCGECWQLVPGDLQQAVYDAYDPHQLTREWARAAMAARRAIPRRS